MIYNYEKKILQIKIVYYGPAMSGKTTSLKYLFAYFNKEDKVTSIDNTVGRTLFFDFGVLPFKGAEWNLNCLVYTATGQGFYSSTRPATLNGVDGIIFVADCCMENLHHNLRSWNELTSLFGNKAHSIPIIISLNKYDIENLTKLSEEGFLNEIDFSSFKDININKTIAISGQGILESFEQLMKFIFPQLTIRINTMR